jgi:ATP-dependent helicase YprA (DUF1998 family)
MKEVLENQKHILNQRNNSFSVVSVDLLSQGLIEGASAFSQNQLYQSQSFNTAEKRRESEF